MAPNRKQLVNVIDPLVDTTPLVQAKYLPLTDSSQVHYEEEQAPRETATVTNPSISTQESDDYWSWPAVRSSSKHTNTTTTTTTTTSTKDLFSVAHLEANLIQDAQRRLEHVTTIRGNDNAATTNYWDERVEARLTRVPNHANSELADRTGYWEWPADSRGVQSLVVALLLRKEFARHETAAATVEQRLIQEEARTKTELPPSSTKPENDDYWHWTAPSVPPAVTVIRATEMDDLYWEWNSSTETSQQNKQRMMDAILADEQRRDMFSVDHIQHKLAQAASTCSTLPAVTTASNNPGYWDW